MSAIISKEKIVHLAVVPGDGPSVYTDCGVNCPQEMVERAMPVEACILAAVDSAIACLTRLLPSTATYILEGKHPVRKLVVILFALRHEKAEPMVCRKSELSSAR